MAAVDRVSALECFLELSLGAPWSDPAVVVMTLIGAPLHPIRPQPPRFTNDPTNFRTLHYMKQSQRKFTLADLLRTSMMLTNHPVHLHHQAGSEGQQAPF
jgi:hypothetical protein